MENTQEYPIHPLAFLSPDRTPEEQALLVESISQLGQVDLITRWRKQIVDGRHRLYACQKLGIEPEFEDLPDDADVLGHVMARQVLGRRMSDSQMAAYVAELCLWSTPGRPRADDENSAEMPSLTQDQAAKLGRVSTRLVGYAKSVVSPESTAVPELRQALRQGQVNAIDACGVLSEPPEVQQKALDLVINGRARTISRAVRQVKQATLPPEDAEPRAAITVSDFRDTITLHAAGIGDLHDLVPAGSVDAVITHPPASQKGVESCSQIAAFAAHALRETGMLVVVALGPMVLPMLKGLDDPALTFIGEWDLVFSGPPWLESGWKHRVGLRRRPVFVFGKTACLLDGGETLMEDLIEVPAPEDLPAGTDRNQEGMFRLMDLFTGPGQVVCDPLPAGRVWTALGAWKAGVRFIGAEPDEPGVARMWQQLNLAAQSMGWITDHNDDNALPKPV